MNLYFKSLFGGLMSTEKFEAKQQKLIEDYKRYLEIEASDDLAEYKRLDAKVKSPEFKEVKRTLINRKYKDTQEYRDTAKYHKLENKESLKLYFEALKSKELTEYLTFKETPDYAKLSNKKEVKASEELKRLKKFEKSKEYKAYVRFHGSYIEKEYLELKEKINHPEFIKSNNFWSNPKRWETTADFQEECKYNVLASDANILFYKEHKREEFKELEEFQMIFNDTFEWKSIDQSKWVPGFYYKSTELVSQHSFANEKQANNGGKNVVSGNGSMHIMTKQEKSEALAWRKDKGLVKTEFEYTSDVINGKDIFCGKHGVFSVKMKFDGSKDVSHAFCLKSGDMLPHINICKCENGELEVGAFGGTLEKIDRAATKIKGINIHNAFVYTLAWNEKELIWYVNNVEVLRTNKIVPQVDMCPMINSFISEGKKGGEADFEIDSIKIYTRK